MPKKASQITARAKKQPARKAASQMKTSNVKDLVTRAVKTYLSTGSALSTGLGALMDGAEMFGNLSSTPVSAPATSSTVLRIAGGNRGRQTSISTTRHPSGGLRLKGVNYCGYLYSSAVSGIPYVYDNSATSHNVGVSAADPAFSVTCFSGDTVTGGSSATQNLFLCPHNCDLDVIGSMYNEWRPISATIHWISNSPTNTPGSLAMAFTGLAADMVNTSVATNDLLGANPNSYINMAQMTSFVEVPLWKSASLPLPFSAAGVCRDRQWLKTSLGFPTATTTLGRANRGSDDACAGSLLMNASTQSTLLGAVLGHIYLEFDFEFLGTTPFQSRSNVYNSIQPLTRIPSSNLEELHDRCQRELKRRTSRVTPSLNCMGHPEPYGPRDPPIPQPQPGPTPPDVDDYEDIKVPLPLQRTYRNRASPKLINNQFP